MVFVIGRKMFSDAVGLLAALVLAATPQFLHAGSIFKPDILLLLCTVLTFYWILGLAADPSRRGYLLAGLEVRLCMSTKLNGGLIAVTVVAVTAAIARWPFARRGLERLGWLALSGVTAAVVFLALNPYRLLTLDFFKMNLAHYEKQATGSHLDAFWQSLGFLFSEALHGPWIGAAAVLGSLALNLLALRGGEMRTGWGCSPC